MINRRELMTGAAVATLGVAAGTKLDLAMAFAQPASINIPAPVVDIHCHIFNSADLPVYGFLKQAVFEVWDTQAGIAPDFVKACHTKGHTSLLSSSGLKFLAWTMDGLMSGAPTAAAEAAALASGVVGAGPGDNLTPMEQEIVEYLAPASPLTSAPPTDPEQRKKQQQRAEIRNADFKPEEFEAARNEVSIQLATEAGDPNAAQGSATIAGRAQLVAAGARENKDGFVTRNWNWAKRMKDSRLNNAKRIAQLYSSPNARIRLFTPALIDYSKWLEDDPQSNLSAQVDAMEQVSLRMARETAAGMANAALFHGYFAYDPLRDVHENGAALTRAKRAVGTSGFLGVKLYPPMGFKPAANATDTTLQFPKHTLTFKRNGEQHTLKPRELAAALDERLASLYRWCTDKGVPILSHAANSNGSGPCYAQRAGIANWGPVVADPRHKGIRICLAHLGSFDAARAGGTTDSPINLSKLDQSWEWQFGNLIANGNAPNLYADLSYFSELLKGEGSTAFKETKAAFVQYVKKFSGADGKAALVDRLIYGSDWIMLDREAKKEEHLRAVYKFMSEVLAEAHPPGTNTNAMLVKIFSTNAIRFLGLQPGNPAAQRLLAFYRRFDLPNADALLSVFNV